jgi:hypothetical protein
VLSYELSDPTSIRQALERRLIGFSTTDLSWKQATDCAIGLSTADVVAAAEDAARREFDSSRPVRAKSGRSLTAWRTRPFEPEGDLQGRPCEQAVSARKRSSA